MSLAALKSRGGNRINKLQDSLKSPYDRQKDDRMWTPTADKSGNAFAVIRFLPERDDEVNPGFVKLFSHGFEGPNGWYIENCLSTLGQDDPVQEHARPFWKLAKNGDGDAEKFARSISRKASYYANVLIVEDKANPEAEGKVFIWRFGQKVFDKLESMFKPESEFETKRDPWDIFGDQGGGNFRVKIRKVGGFNNYDLCAFDAPSAISINGKALADKAIERVLSECHHLDPIIGADKFKSHAELKTKMESVLGIGGQTAPRQRRVEEEDKVPVATSRREAPVLSADKSDEDYLADILADDDDD